MEEEWGEEESEQVSLSLLQQSPFRTENFYIIGVNANTSPSTIPAFTPALRSGKCYARKAPSLGEFQEQPQEEKLKILRSSGDTRRRRTYASCGPFNSKNPFLWLATPQPVFRFDFVCFAKIIFVFFLCFESCLLQDDGNVYESLEFRTAELFVFMSWMLWSARICVQVHLWTSIVVRA